MFIFFLFSFPADVEVYFPPGCKKIIFHQLENAKNEILVAMYCFTDPDIRKKLCKMAKNIKVKVLLDKKEAKKKYSQYKNLIMCGIPVKCYVKDGLMHNKFAVIDTFIVITGSFNWTKGAEEKNEENLVIIKSQEVAKIYVDKFYKFWREK